jgi:hypothetical protein
MDPVKVVEFTKHNILTAEAKKYAEHLINEEIPQGLQRYFEAEIVPHLGLKVKWGLSKQTAQEWLHKMGWEYSEHKKAIFLMAMNIRTMLIIDRDHSYQE